MSANSERGAWRVWIDTGGTFTDCVARDPDGRVHRAKVLSASVLTARVEARPSHDRVRIAASWAGASPAARGMRLVGGPAGREPEVIRHDGPRRELRFADTLPPRITPGGTIEIASDEPAAILAARVVIRTAAGETLPPLSMRLATTRGTNALLERRGGPTALFITAGFGDLLRIGDQQRPDLFTLRIDRPAPLYDAVVDVHERLSADGSILQPIDLERLRRDAERVREQGITSAAVALLHSYRNPEHEQSVVKVLRAGGFEHIAASTDLAPLIRILPRAQTAVVEAYLRPVMSAYLADVGRCVPGRRMHVMTSAGGLVQADRYRAADGLLSGPAGGVVGAAHAARASGYDRAIGFDMGGTSTDVSRYDGDFEYTFEHRVGDARLLAPALAIETVAAGGGSICGVEHGRLRVGPASAGADPGPACYGRGGPLTITDVNLLLGRIDSRQFEIPIDRRASRTAFDAVLNDLRRQRSDANATDEHAVLDGFLAIANERVAAAIEQISVRRGYDPADYALVSFGGAGGQHACAVADHLGIRTIIMPADASLLSAVGLGHAVVERFAQRQVLALLTDVADDLAGVVDALAEEAVEAIVEEGAPREDVVVRRRIVNARLRGQDTSLALEVDRPPTNVAAIFRERYLAMYGHAPPHRPIEIESVRVVASTRPPQADGQAASTPQTRGRRSDPDVRRIRFGGEWMQAPVVPRDAMQRNEAVDGPALITEPRSAYVVEDGWRATVDDAGALVLKHAAPHALFSPAGGAGPRRQPQAVELELFTNRFRGIADGMGRMLERTALSTNVKERLDFSCTLLDADGRLIVNAPHMPVHLGSMGLCVRSVMDAITMNEGDVVVTNHPAYGGSHLPDITVISPVFDDGGRRVGFVANRAHHAEVGGTRPGSMPPAAKTLAEEGVVIPPMHLVRAGEAQFDALADLLSGGPHPSRQVQENLADLRAQLAANHHGAAALRDLARAFGPDAVAQQMAALTDLAERATRQAIAARPAGRCEAVERLDDGSPIHVTINIAGDRAAIDFTGTASQHPGNLNATPAIVRSAVLYVLRLMLGEAHRSVPLNEGVLRPVTMNLPPGLLNPAFDDDPQRCPAVVGGNVETSQRLVDTLLKALALAACSQGTMNNTLFGNDRFGYYETVCGGSGAGRDFHGTHAVHTHMTNTRITDAEILEQRYPVRLERFAIRRGSGGAGKFRGGDGAVRELTFLEPMALSVLAQHRRETPYGLDGGEPGAVGRGRLVRADGTVLDLGSIDGTNVRPGDRFILETPGGGGFGEPPASDADAPPAGRSHP